MNSWGTVSKDNYLLKCQDNAKYKSQRIFLATILKPLLNQAIASISFHWFIDNGTLIGAFRDNGKMLPHDDDFDIGIISDDLSYQLLFQFLKKNLPQNLDVRQTNSYCQKLEVFNPQFDKYIFGQGYDYYNVSIDVQLYKYDQKMNVLELQYWKDNFNQKFNPNIDDILPVRTILFQGVQFNAPRNIQNHLRQLYGYLGQNCYYDNASCKYKKIQLK